MLHCRFGFQKQNFCLITGALPCVNKNNSQNYSEFIVCLALIDTSKPLSQEILSLGNSVAATIFPKEIMSLPGNSVAHARCTCSIDTSWLSLQRMEQREYDVLLAFCCDCKYPPECSKNEKDCIRRRAKNFIVKVGTWIFFSN